MLIVHGGRRTWKFKKSTSRLFQVRSKHWVCLRDEFHCRHASSSLLRGNCFLDFRNPHRGFWDERRLWTAPAWTLQALLCHSKFAESKTTLALWTFRGTWYLSGDVCIGLDFLFVLKFDSYFVIRRFPGQLFILRVALFLQHVPLTSEPFQEQTFIVRRDIRNSLSY